MALDRWVAYGHDGIIEEALARRSAGASAARPTSPPPRAMTDPLSRRELEVLRLMAEGLSNREIADALFVSVRTVAGHVTNILAKLDRDSRTGAVAFAIRNGLV